MENCCRNKIAILKLANILLTVAVLLLSLASCRPRAGAVESERASTTAGLSGIVTDGNGNGVTAALQLCGDLCWPLTTDRDGSFAFSTIPAGGYLLKAASIDSDHSGESLCHGEIAVEIAPLLDNPVLLQLSC